MRSILDPKFKYTSSMETDIRKTFERVRRERREAEARKKPDEQDPAGKLKLLFGDKTGS